MKKLLLSILTLLAIPSFSFAAYSIGLSATSTATPWASVNQVNGVSQSLRANTVIATSTTVASQLPLSSSTSITASNMINTAYLTASQWLQSTSGYFGPTTSAGMNTNINSNTLSFRSGNTDNRLVIGSTGNVGIGTTSPISSLDIAHDISTLTITDTGAGANQHYWNIISNRGSLFFGTTSDALDNQARYMAIAPGGFVGIGIDTPAAKLEIKNGSEDIQFASNNTGIGGIVTIAGKNGTNLGISAYTPSATDLVTEFGINDVVDGTSGNISYAITGSKKAPSIQMNAETGTIKLFGENGTGGNFRVTSPNLGLTINSNGTAVTTNASSTLLSIATGLYLTGTAGGGTKCLQIDNNGLVAAASGACGTAGGASGTWSTTTSTVTGQQVNYSNNTTDIVNIGSSATTTGKFWVDPNTNIVYVRGSLGIGTTSPYAPLSVIGQVVASNFTATSTTATSLFQGVVALDAGSNTIPANAWFNIGSSTPNLYVDKFSGSVGIGTSRPQEVNANSHLTVSGTASQDIIASTTDNTASSDAIFNAYAPGSRVFLGAHGTNQVTTQYGVTVGGYGELAAINSSSGTSNGLIIGTRTTATPIVFGTNSLERMRILSGGNVGIGTTSPYAPLSVFGQVVGSYFTATSTTIASTLPYASTTALTVSNVADITTFKSMKNYPGFSYATTTWSATTTIPLPPAFQAQTWNSIACATDVGTVNVQLFNTNLKMTMVPVTVTPSAATLSTNNTLVAFATTSVQIGTPASSPTTVSCTLYRSIPNF